MFYTIIYNVIYVLDIGFSFASRLFLTPFNQAVDAIFGGYVIFDTIIYNTHINLDIPNFGLVSQLVSDIFELMFGWTRLIIPADYFGLCLILGTFGNFVFISVIHWLLKLIKEFIK